MSTMIPDKPNYIFSRSWPLFTTLDIRLFFFLRKRSIYIFFFVFFYLHEMDFQSIVNVSFCFLISVFFFFLVIRTFVWKFVFFQFKNLVPGYEILFLLIYLYKYMSSFWSFLQWFSLKRLFALCNKNIAGVTIVFTTYLTHTVLLLRN